MSIATEIQRIKANIENAYTKAEEKGATIPTTKNSENLATTIESIPESSEVVINTQEKTATPSKSTQDITPDSGYYLSKVVVNPIPDEYIVPSGSQDITANGTYDITDKAEVVVNVASSGGSSENTLKKLLDYTKSCYQMFYGNKNITDLTGCIGYNDTSNVTNMGGMFNGCTNLQSVPLFDTSNVTDMNRMFQNCNALKSSIDFNTSKVTNFTYMFYNDYSLETIKLDFKSATSATVPFYTCNKLINLTILNIKINLTVGSGTSYGHLLTLESLLGLCQECVNVNSSKTLTVGSENITKLSNVYVKLTGEAEEDETLPKLPMVQCESTDDGAMTISDYMSLKNWSLA